MRQETREVAERTILGTAAVVGSWEMQHWSTLASLVLTTVMIGWVITQWVKFVITWVDEREQKKAAKAAREKMAEF